MTLAIFVATTMASSHAITLWEAVDAILNRNGDRMLTELSREAKNAKTLGMANAPDPQIEGDYMVAPAGEDNRWGVGISYELEWPGAYGARRNLAKAMRNANSAEADAAFLSKRLEILNEIEAYLYADSRLSVMQNVMSTSDSIRAIAERAARGGELSRLDLSKIAIEQSRMQSMISNIKAEKLAIEGNLKTLNGGMDCKALLEQIDKTFGSTPLAPLDRYLAGAKNNPELAKAMSEYQVAERNVSVAKAERLPNFSIGYAHEFEDGMHFNGASIRVSVPLFASRHKVKAAEAAKAAAEYQMTVSTDVLESDINSLYVEIQTLDKALATPANVFSTTDYPTLLLKAYDGGELSLTDYLSELSWFYEAHLEFIDLQYQREQKANRLSLLCK